MNFAKFQQLVEHRTGFRTMENPTASGEYFSDSCGDLYTFFLKVGPGDVIEDISYFTTGCGFGTATCSLLVELTRGKTIDEALAITDADIEAALDGYPEKKKDYPERSRFALQAAVEDYRAGRAAGRITDAMLEQARGIAAAAAASSAPGTGTTEEDAKAGPSILEDAGMLTIKLH
ncbi:MAG TPA: iron-sulfur cluster assembly scaffold protein [Candidatus Elarobacter sp.]|jgi:NifU-like protein involved in Fe-S cluster formation|nr:iron-sulfur cluster assembly scaffold protein [Candidatus Elarobacter sp.]